MVTLVAEKGKTKAEIAEEKSFWDEDEDGETKKPEKKDVEQPAKAKKAATEPEVAEEKSFWDDVADEPKKTKTEEVSKSDKGKKSVTEPEVAEEKSFWDENHNEQNKQPIIEEVESETQVGKKATTKPDIAEEIPVEEEFITPKKSRKESLQESMSAETEGIFTNLAYLFKQLQSRLHHIVNKKPKNYVFLQSFGLFCWI